MNRTARAARNLELNQVLDILQYANEVCTKLKQDLPGLLANVNSMQERQEVSQLIASQYDDRLESNDINYEKVQRHIRNRAVAEMYRRYLGLLADIGSMWADFYNQRPNLQVVRNNRSNVSSVNSRHRRRRNRKTRRRRN